MVRPHISKNVRFMPDVTYFKPRGVPLRDLEEVTLTHEELESLRLANIEKLSQEKAAEKMGCHQSTFQRTIARAREKLTDALVNGKAIKIHGGAYKMPGGDGLGPRGLGLGKGHGVGKGQGSGRGAGMGRGFGRRQGFGGPEVCVCPKCRTSVPHALGVPCRTQKCPNCGESMEPGTTPDLIQT